MQRATVLLIALCLSLLPALGAAAATGCISAGTDTSVRSACCCGGDSQCEMPGSGDASSLTASCCQDDSGTPTPASAPVSTAPVHLETAPVQDVGTDLSPAAVPHPPVSDVVRVPQHPPHYTLFCSLLI